MSQFKKDDTQVHHTKIADIQNLRKKYILKGQREEKDTLLSKENQ